MKLSIVIICWNDLKVILDCLRSIYQPSPRISFEVIVSDNGSSDGSPERIREEFPAVRIVENGANLGFAKGNNSGIRAANGEFVLILNPDTIIHGDALEKMVQFAERHPEAGAVGCRVLNPDGSFQNPARPLPSMRGLVIAALCQRWLGYLTDALLADKYVGWDGMSEREIGYQSGCCILVKGDLLRRLGGFDEQFFYHYEETDLCKRIWDAGCKIVYTPDAVITHLGGQSVGRFPVKFALETGRSRYRYFAKHFGASGARMLRWLWLMHIGLRWAGYRLKSCIAASDVLQNRLKMYGTVLKWNWQVDPVEFVRTGAEPNLGYEPLAPAVPQIVKA